MPDLFKRAPTSVRRGIPFYHAKSEEEFREDVYERYDELVTRQTALHLADELHGGYPFQPLLAYVLKWTTSTKASTLLDVGCSVGRIAAELARRNPAANVAGVDFSYQMLRQAKDYWVAGETLRPKLLRYGFGTPSLEAPPLGNITFALARAEDMPFADASYDAVINTFLLDRLPDPYLALAEFHRILRPGARLITVTPLNFLSAKGWRDAHPPVKIAAYLQANGWELLDWTDPLTLFEPMDLRGNGVSWRCLAFVARKK